MITLQQARELAELINKFTDRAIDIRELKCTMEEFNEAKRAMASYLSKLVVQ